MLTLEIKAREVGQSLNKIRNNGDLPAVFYGKKEDSTPVSVNAADFLKVWKQAGESSVIVLKSPKGDLEALIHDVDVDPVTEVPRHADFYVFEKGHQIEVDVPLKFVGVAPAAKDLGGVLIKVLHELKIKAMPKDLPHELEVDISTLVNFESQVLASDIKLPSGVTLLEEADEVVALVSEPKEEKEEAPVDISSIEVEKKGKKEEESAGDEAAPSESSE